jgi:hypothetical protein
MVPPASGCYVLAGRVGVQLGDGVLEVVGRYQLEIDFGSIPVLAERHGLRLA